MNSAECWPREIWLNICRFVPALALQDLYSVNHVFFELAMDQRYRQISLAYLTKNMIRTLLRLQSVPLAPRESADYLVTDASCRDPAVAKRVRILHIHPHFVKDIMEKDSLPIMPAHRFRAKIYDIAKNIRDPGSLKFLKSGSRPRSMSFRTSKDLMKIVLSVLTNLPALDAYHIMWCGEGSNK